MKPSELTCFAVAVVLLGCPVPTVIAVPDAAVEVVDSGPAPVVDAGPPAPAVVTPTGSWLLVDGGSAPLEVKPLSRVDIEPALGLDVALPAPLKDYRLRFFDGQDKVMESDDSFIATDAGIEGHFRFLEALKPGREFQLSLEAQLGTQVTDVNGRVFEDFELKFKTTGEYVPDAKPGRPQKKKPAKKK